MKPLKYCILLIIYFITFNCFAQDEHKTITAVEYINLYKDIAVKDMNTYRIPASITLAQGLLESNNGNSDLATKANNHFGIKCHKEWKGETYIKDDDAKDECFRMYKNAEESYKDHSSFLRTRVRYASLFYLDITNYKAWAEGLKAAGYATNPNYPKQLIKIIEDNCLYEYDSGFQKKDIAAYQQPGQVTFLITDDDDEDFSPINIGGNNRAFFLNNDIKFVFVKSGDTFEKIAKDLEIKPEALYHYNDFPKEYKLKVGEKVYIESKRRKGFAEFHIVQKGDNMLTISQFYGIKLTQLYKKNKMEQGTKLIVGQKLWLRKKKQEN